MGHLRRRFKGTKADPEAAEALAESTKSVHKARKRDPEVKEVSRKLRLMRERNHFREQLEAIMGGVIL